MSLNRRQFLASFAAAVGSLPVDRFSGIFPAASSLHDLKPDALLQVYDVVEELLRYRHYGPVTTAWYKANPSSAKDLTHDWVGTMQSIHDAAGGIDGLADFSRQHPAFNFRWVLELTQNPKAATIIADAITAADEASPRYQVMFWGDEKLSIGQSFLKKLEMLRDSESSPISLIHHSSSLDEALGILRENLAGEMEALPALQPGGISPDLRAVLDYCDREASPTFRALMTQPPESIRASLENLKSAPTVDGPAQEGLAGHCSYKYLDVIHVARQKDGAWTTRINKPHEVDVTSELNRDPRLQGRGIAGN